MSEDMQSRLAAFNGPSQMLAANMFATMCPVENSMRRTMGDHDIDPVVRYGREGLYAVVIWARIESVLVPAISERPVPEFWLIC